MIRSWDTISWMRKAVPRLGGGNEPEDSAAALERGCV
jgi:hypothetical protein